MKGLLFCFCFIFILFSFSNSQEIIVIKSSGNVYYLEKKSVPHSKKTFRKTVKHKREAFYIAGKKSKVFHRPDCPFAKRLKSKVMFKTRYQAVKKGLRPCRKCKP